MKLLTEAEVLAVVSKCRIAMTEDLDPNVFKIIELTCDAMDAAVRALPEAAIDGARLQRVLNADARRGMQPTATNTVTLTIDSADWEAARCAIIIAASRGKESGS